MIQKNSGSKLAVLVLLLSSFTFNASADCDQCRGQRAFVPIEDAIPPIDEASLPEGMMRDFVLNCDFCISPCFKGLMNHICPVIKPDGYTCVDNCATGTTCFGGDVGIAQNKKLLVNVIAPVKDVSAYGCPPDVYDCEEDITGTVCILGDLVIDPNRKLLTNFICASKFDDYGNCVEDPNGVVTICNMEVEMPPPDFNCVEEFSMDPCSKILTNFIDPVKQMGEYCVEDPYGTTCFSGDVGLNVGKKLLVNEINPVQMIWDPYCTEYVCEEDEFGATCFSGNVVFKKEICVNKQAQFKENVCIDDCHRLLVNRIEPKSRKETCFIGDVGIQFGKKLLVNEINPVRLGELVGECGVYFCEEDEYGTTCFSGNVGIHKGRKLFVDFICASTFDDYGNCIEDPDGKVTICGLDVDIPTLDCVEELTMKPCAKILTNFIDPVKFEFDTYGDCIENSKTGTTCFSGDVAVDACKKLLVNRICSVIPAFGDCYQKNCKEDPLGCIEFCSKKVKIPGTLLVNKLQATQPCKGDPEIMKVSSDTCFEKDLEVTGALLHPIDERLKTNIEALTPEESLMVINALKPQKFAYNQLMEQEGRELSETQIGFSARGKNRATSDLIHVSPVREINDVALDDFESIDYGKLIVHLVSAMQGQQEQILECEDELEDYRLELKNLHQELARLADH